MESSLAREIRVLVVRELEGHVEIFLRKNLSELGEYQEFRGNELSSDPSCFFTAARVLLIDLLGLGSSTEAGQVSLNYKNLQFHKFQ
jgi:hypothetical protein